MRPELRPDSGRLLLVSVALTEHWRVRFCLVRDVIPDTGSSAGRPLPHRPLMHGGPLICHSPEGCRTPEIASRG